MQHDQRQRPGIAASINVSAVRVQSGHDAGSADSSPALLSVALSALNVSAAYTIHRSRVSLRQAR